MSERQKLTAIIPAGHAENHLEACIASVRDLADEVLVVVDSASQDRTEEIAREFADTVLVHEYKNSAAQKNWTIPQARHPWILLVDTDERATDELKRDVLEVLKNDGPADGYRIHRINHFMGQRINGCGWQRDDVLRLFRRDKSKYEDKHVHADIIPKDPSQPLNIDRLSGKFLHYTFDSFDQYLKKHSRYASWAGEDRAAKTKKVTLRHLAGRPAWRFFRQYIMYGGWKDGIAGFVICWMAAHSVFLKYAYAWEKKVKENKNKQASEK